MQNNKKPLAPPSDFSARAQPVMVLVPGHDGAMKAAFVPPEGGIVVLQNGNTEFIFPRPFP
jgi:hypothetical protein